jgi:hypothetical protein
LCVDNCYRNIVNHQFAYIVSRPRRTRYNDAVWFVCLCSNAIEQPIQKRMVGLIARNCYTNRHWHMCHRPVLSRFSASRNENPTKRQWAFRNLMIWQLDWWCSIPPSQSV